MAYPGRLRALVQPLRAYAGTPLQDLARRSGLTRLFGPEIEAIKELLPPLVPESFIDRLPTITPPAESPQQDGSAAGFLVALFRYRREHRHGEGSEAHGFEAVIPPNQRCGAAV